MHRKLAAARRPAASKVLIIAIMATLGFWLGNIGFLYAVEAVPSISLEPNAPTMPDPFEFVMSRVDRPLLGISTDKWPVLVGIAAAVGIVAGASAKSHKIKPDISIDEVHGSQELATVEDRAIFEHRKETAEWPCPSWCAEVEDDNIIVTQRTKLAGTSNPDYEIEQMCSNRHVFIMGASGRGKTYTLVGPNILQLNGSLVISDPKGEIFRKYAAFLEANGYEVECLNLRDEEMIRASSCYNPLMYTDDITAINQCVLYFIENTKGEDHEGDKAFFINMETLFYSAIIGLFVFWFKANGHPGDCTMPAIIDYLLMAKDMAADGPSALDTVFYGDPASPEIPSFKDYVVARYERGEEVLLDKDIPEVAVLDAYTMYKSNAGDPETEANVISSVAARLSKFNNPAIRRLLSRDDLDLSSMGKRKRALFLGVKAETGPYDFVAAMALNQLFDQNVSRAASSPTGHLDIPIWCWLDELANIGKIPNLSKLFAVTRSYWINLVAIVQDGKQLEARYGKDAESIISNSAVFVFLGSKRWEDCELVSKQMGNTTRMAREVTRTTNPGGGVSVQESFRPYSVPLMSPAELYNFDYRRGTGFDPSKCLTHYFGSNWCLDDKFDLKTHRRYPELKAAGDTDFVQWSRCREAARTQRAHRSLPPAEDAAEIDLDQPGTFLVDT